MTKRALELCGFRSGAVLADIGRGIGGSVKYVNENTQYKMTGIDKDASVIGQNSDCIEADASSLPFADSSCDGILFQCSFSKIEEPDKALSEAYRVLEKNGKIAIADFFARKEERQFSGAMGRTEHRERIMERIERAGFKILLFEDHTKEMMQLWGQLIFDCDEKTLEKLFGNMSTLAASKCGYGLFIAGKEAEQ